VIVRVLRRASAGLAVVALVTACDNNPLADNRDRGEWFDLNPSNVAVNAGGTVLVTAVVRNQFGAATNAPVTATPCDAKVSAVRDTTRSAFEFPERFVVTGASSLGTSCLVVSGGGLTDTIRVRVVPASIRVSGADTLTQLVGSGETVQAQVEFRNTAGAPATGFTLSDVTFTSLTPAQAAVDASGQISGQAPGIGRVVVRLHSQYGVTRVDTLVFRVQAGAFGGTVVTGTTGPPTGSIAVATFTEGAVAFDADTEVQLVVDGVTVRTFNLVTTGTTRQVVLPFGLPAGNLRYNVVNIGPNQIAQTGTISLPNGTPAEDTQEPDEVRLSTPKVASVGQRFWGSVGGSDFRDWVRIDIAEAGNYRFSMGWNDGSDHDFYVHNAAGSTLLSLEQGPAGNPESGSLSNLQPGTYYLRAEIWDWTPNQDRASTYYMLVEKL
jgi:hypothetical protein